MSILKQIQITCWMKQNPTPILNPKQTSLQNDDNFQICLSSFFVNIICLSEQVCLPSPFVTAGPSGPLVKMGPRPAAWLTCNLVSRLQSWRLHQYSVTAPIVCRPRRALQTQLPPPLPPLSGPRSPPWKSIVSSWITKGCFSSTAPRVSTWTQLTTPCWWWYSVGGAGVFSRVEPAPSRWA